MSERASHIGSHAAELRHAFDRAFAAPVRIDTTVKENLLAIRVGPDGYALRLTEIAGLFADRKVTRVPGGEPALLGIAGFRGAILPVYSLPILLGQSSGATPRWLVIAAVTPVALAFDGFDKQLSVAPDAILPAQSRAETRREVRDFVRTADFSGPILHLPSVLDAIKTARPDAPPRKEQ